VATATPASTPTPTPTPVATPGILQVGYSIASPAPAVSVAPTAAPPTAAFVAVGQSAAVTVSQANYTGAYTTSINGAGCSSALSLTPGSSSGQYTLNATGSTVSLTCTVSFQGAAGTAPVSLSVTVPAPGGVVIQWVANAALATASASNPVTPNPGPVNLIGTTSTFGVVLVVSETHYLGTLNAPTLSGACGANLSAPTATTQGNILGPQPAQAVAYYTLSAPSSAAAFPISAGCTVSATDSQATPSTGTIGVSLTTTSGGIE
jgi:hypothetical protein